MFYQTSKQTLWFKKLIFLPILALLVYNFSDRNIIPIQSEIKIQDKASSKEVREYNALAKHYNEMNKTNIIVRKNEIERLKYIYNKMSLAQRRAAEPFPAIPPAPPSPVVMKGEVSNIPPPPPPAPRVKKGELSEIPPPPPPAPISPLDHIVKMAKKGASFYYNDNKISSDKAIALLKKNDKLNISGKTVNGEYEVRISN